MPDGSTEAVEGSYHEHINSPSLHKSHQLIESWPSIRGTGDALIDELGNVIQSAGTAVFT
jgi:hypothetical protein